MDENNDARGGNERSISGVTYIACGDSQYLTTVLSGDRHDDMSTCWK